MEENNIEIPKKKPKILIILIILILLGLAGYYLYDNYNRKLTPPTTIEEEPPKEEEEPNEVIKFKYEIKDNEDEISKILYLNDNKTDIEAININVNEFDNILIVSTYDNYFKKLYYIDSNYKITEIELETYEDDLIVGKITPTLKGKQLRLRISRYSDGYTDWYCHLEELKISKKLIGEYIITYDIVNKELTNRQIESQKTIEELYKNTTCNKEEIKEKEIKRQDLIKYLNTYLDENNLRNKENLKSFNYGKARYVGYSGNTKYYSIQVTYECNDGDYDCVYKEQWVEEPTTNIIEILYTFTYENNELKIFNSFIVKDPDYVEINEELK